MECSSDDEIYVDIHERVSKLSRGVLTLPENNELLLEALEYDELCLKKLQSQPILSKTCEYGAKLSGIVLDKAFQINAYDTQESLKKIIDSFLYKFPMHSCQDYNNSYKRFNDSYNHFNNSHEDTNDKVISIDIDSKTMDSDEDENVKIINDNKTNIEDIKMDEDNIPSTPVRPNPLATDAPLESRIQISKYNKNTPKSSFLSRELEFNSLSKYFYGSSLSFSCLEWDIMPIEKLPRQKKQRKRTVRDKSNTATISLDTISHTNEEIENCILVDQLISKLRQLTFDKPLPFWQFILDTDEINGFNNTCYNLYALTLIVSKGYASITNIANQLYIQVSHILFIND